MGGGGNHPSPNSPNCQVEVEAKVPPSLHDASVAGSGRSASLLLLTVASAGAGGSPREHLALPWASSDPTRGGRERCHVTVRWDGVSRLSPWSLLTLRGRDGDRTARMKVLVRVGPQCFL